jgi:hypothetical protein
MNTARLELCKELYTLSGWNETDYFYQFIEYPDSSSGFYLTNPTLEAPLHAEAYPAYDLGYLLRRLPKNFVLRPIPGAQWEIHYAPGVSNTEKICQADTPEDAACELTIELFRRRVFEQRENGHG